MLPALGLLAGGLAALGAGALASATVPGQYVVIAAPGTGAREAISLIMGAGGAMISAGGFNNILYAASDNAAFPEALRAAGAWLVLPAPTFLGCTTDRLEN